jgi:haloacetate dehalogenase
MFDGFELKRIKTENADINLRVGGQGEALILLHGYPQTHACWHKMAPILRENFTVIIPDLRGYGDSVGPDPDIDNQLYSKRAMARDIKHVLNDLSVEVASIVGHDRGGRVAYRFALDHPDRIRKLVVLDIIPTSEMWEKMTAQAFISGYHWQFLAQPHGLPEYMIGLDSERYLRHTLDSWAKIENSFSTSAMTEYLRCFSNASVIASCCADYRAGATSDWENDKLDKQMENKIGCPVMTLWGQREGRNNLDNISIWNDWCDQPVFGHSVQCGHFLPEENPIATLKAIIPFLERI